MKNKYLIKILFILFYFVYVLPVFSQKTKNTNPSKKSISSSSCSEIHEICKRTNENRLLTPIELLYYKQNLRKKLTNLRKSFYYDTSNRSIVKSKCIQSIKSEGVVYYSFIEYISILTDGFINYKIALDKGIGNYKDYLEARRKADLLLIKLAEVSFLWSLEGLILTAEAAELLKMIENHNDNIEDTQEFLEITNNVNELLFSEKIEEIEDLSKYLKSFEMNPINLNKEIKEFYDTEIKKIYDLRNQVISSQEAINLKEIDKIRDISHKSLTEILKLEDKIDEINSITIGDAQFFKCYIENYHLPKLLKIVNVAKNFLCEIRTPCRRTKFVEKVELNYWALFMDHLCPGNTIETFTPNNPKLKIFEQEDVAFRMTILGVDLNMGDTRYCIETDDNCNCKEMIGKRYNATVAAMNLQRVKPESIDFLGILKL